MIFLLTLCCSFISTTWVLIQSFKKKKWLIIIFLFVKFICRALNFICLICKVHIIAVSIRPPYSHSLTLLDRDNLRLTFLASQKFIWTVVRKNWSGHDCSSLPAVHYTKCNSRQSRNLAWLMWLKKKRDLLNFTKLGTHAWHLILSPSQSSRKQPVWLFLLTPWGCKTLSEGFKLRNHT